MYFKKIKSFIAILLIATFIMPQPLLAYSKYIIAGGENIGLQVNNNGVIIAGFYKVSDNYPGYDASLKQGDIIVEVDNKKVNTIDEFVGLIENSNQKNLKIGYLRNNTKHTTNLNLFLEDGVIKTGLYVKDKITGIGTLTFIDPNTKLYGALGHEIIEKSTGVMVEVKDGKIYSSKVTSVDKSVRGNPGCKNASIEPNDVYGNILENTKTGVFGKYLKDINNTTLYEVGKYEDIKKGTAKIITVLNGNEKKEYDINILNVNNNINDNKNILFEVTDNNLIEKTGGIVQGMSGSPIIQDNKIIGAVTNVVVNNPKKGYGVLITSMLEEAEN